MQENAMNKKKKTRLGRYSIDDSLQRRRREHGYRLRTAYPPLLSQKSFSRDVSERGWTPTTSNDTTVKSWKKEKDKGLTLDEFHRHRSYTTLLSLVFPPSRHSRTSHQIVKLFSCPYFLSGGVCDSSARCGTLRSL